MQRWRGHMNTLSVMVMKVNNRAHCCFLCKN